MRGPALVALAIGVLAITVVTTSSTTVANQAASLAAAPAEDGCGWAAPVDAEIVDSFRPPEHRFGPGNRGLEYATTDGQEVTAVASGQVSFTGPVGGALYVVVAHGHDLRSTYGPLAGATVVRGQQVGQAEPLGAAATGFHLTARRGERYIDPEPLLAGQCSQLRLVPPPTGRIPSHERVPIRAGP